MRSRWGERAADLLPLMVVAIAGTIAFAWLAFVVLQDREPHRFWEPFYRWDTRNFVEIARDGYPSVDTARHQWAFFPVYPLLIRLFHVGWQPWTLAAIVAANASWVLATWLLYELVRLDHTRDTALRTVMYLAAFPTGYFLHLGYSESTFLAAAIASFLFARHGQWWGAGLAAAVATGTRFQGVVLLPALAVEYWMQRDRRGRLVAMDVLALALVPLGAAAFAAWGLWVEGRWAAFFRAQRVWGRHVDWPWSGLRGALSTTEWRAPSDGITIGWMEIGFAAVGLVLTIACVKKLRASYATYAVLGFAVTVSNSLWMGVPRYLLSVFPIFLALALVARGRNVEYPLLLASLLLQGLYLARFAQGAWTF